MKKKSANKNIMYLNLFIVNFLYKFIIVCILSNCLSNSLLINNSIMLVNCCWLLYFFFFSACCLRPRLWASCGLRELSLSPKRNSECGSKTYGMHVSQQVTHRRVLCLVFFTSILCQTFFSNFFNNVIVNSFF